MKKLNKLQINSEKIMKNEELVLLRGGYGLLGYCCWCFGGDNPGVMVGPTTEAECESACDAIGSDGSWYC